MTAAPTWLLLAGSLLAVVCRARKQMLHQEVEVAPSTLLAKTGGLQTREQGPTAWACACFDNESPWIGHNALYRYINKGNTANKDYTLVTLFPIQRIYSLSKPMLCLYLPKEDHCALPNATANDVTVDRIPGNLQYIALRFWGDIPRRRIRYLTKKFDQMILDEKIKVETDSGYLSEFPNHAKELRYNLLTGPDASKIPFKAPSWPFPPEIKKKPQSNKPAAGRSTTQPPRLINSAQQPSGGNTRQQLYGFITTARPPLGSNVTQQNKPRQF